jgi:hypothetical protein
MINQTRNNRALFGLMSFGVSGIGFVICLTLLLARASASGQTLAPTREAPRNEPLEVYDNPPAPPRKMETSPRMISRFGPFVSFQVNVDANGNNIIGDAANECAISVDPTDGNKMTSPGDNLTAYCPISGRAAGVIPPMAASAGHSPVFCKTTFSAVTR